MHAVVVLALTCPALLASAAPAAQSPPTVVPISSSRTLDIGGDPYYIPADPLVTLPSSAGVLSSSTDVLLFTAFGSNVTGAALEETVARWTEKDDVFAPAFLQAALIQSAGKQVSLPASAAAFLAQRDTRTLLLSNAAAPSANGARIATVALRSLPTQLAPGPYILARAPSGAPAVFIPYRLFFDDTQSFLKSTTPRPDGSFAPVSAALDTDSSPYIAVPSRAYAEAASAAQALAGVRVSVKDIYFLQGLRASAGNRAFYALYGPRNATGPAVSRLSALGANIVGVTKTVQFANGDRATADWVDYHAPFVVRSDGYAEPSGSSTGAAAGISAHEFLDVAIGSDTGGSIRGPAGVNGLYGLRPSVGAISLEDVVPLSDVLDTGGYIARDPKLFATFGRAWYDGSPAIAPFPPAESNTTNSTASVPSFPRNVLLSTDFARVSTAARAVYDAFFTQLGGFLNATSTNFNIAEAWNATSGTGVPLGTWLNSTYPTLIAFHQWTAVGAQFFADYAAANGGRTPHINPAVLSRWQFGIAQGESGNEVALNQRETFENWTLNNFLLSNAQSCSDSLFLYPQNAGSYSSREAYFLGPSSPPFGFSSGRIAVHARSPDLVIPIGQVPFNSTISGVTEQVPVTVSVVARRGCDFMLLALLDALADAGIVRAVKTGRTAF